MSTSTSAPQDPIDTALVVRLYTVDQLTVRQIAARVGRSHTAVHRALIRTGTPRRGRGSADRRISAQVCERVLASYLNGDPMADICAAQQVSAQSVRNIVADAGYELRAIGGRRQLDLEQVDELAGQGWPPAAVAMLTGFSEGHVRRQMRQLGYVRPALPEGPVLAGLLAEHGSVRAVAREVGCSARRIKGALERAGVDVPTRQGRRSHIELVDS
ncbi:hypothetical protein ETD86_13025 [Nonomuraea turkmeniaca]|uniref:Helix-turn-helix domain-containing protein n=1 Tax=Nonomuraea turkmeniaca TaxID=103838 RepID=A0A5S4FN32_9ACTN|nr:hypothetical protein [Nonomuraea turkmeniaca]TMR22085.1 hypothetical protein ETD86_13025 [Nonomuraea turkmeniaca]